MNKEKKYNKMKYHKFRFRFKKNIKVLICRIFGHRINNNPEFEWCERCGLAYEECYYPKNYYKIMNKKYKHLNKQQTEPTEEKKGNDSLNKGIQILKEKIETFNLAYDEYIKKGGNPKKGCS